MKKLMLCFMLLVYSLSPATVGGAAELRLGVSDVEGEEDLHRNWGPFATALSCLSGLEVVLVPMFSRVDPADRLRGREVDVIVVGPSEYVIIRKKAEAHPLVSISRPDYYSVVVVMAKSGITEPVQLKGKKVGFGPLGSTSGHLAPMQILAENGVDPRTEIKAVNLELGKAWEGLKRGALAAVGLSHDQFLDYRKQDPLPAGGFRVIARCGDLPNDMLMVGGHVDPARTAHIREVIIKHEESLLRAILKGPGNAKYKGSVFLSNVDDDDYDPIRRMYRTIGYPAFAE